MIFIKTDKNNVKYYEHRKPFDSLRGLGKTKEELLKIGFLVDEVPEFDHIVGKTQIIKYTVEDGFTCEYKDFVQPDSIEDQLAAKDIRIKNLETTQSQLNADLVEFMNYYFENGGI